MRARGTCVCTCTRTPVPVCIFLCRGLYGNSEVCGRASLTLQQFLLDSGGQLSPLGALHDAVDVAVQVPLASLHQPLQQVTHLLHTETSPQVRGGHNTMFICHICTGGPTKGEQPSDSFPSEWLWCNNIHLYYFSRLIHF